MGPLARLEELTRRIERLEGATAFDPWYPSETFEEQFRGGEQELLERYRELAARLQPHAPVLDFGCGRGEFLLLLDEFKVDAMGVEIDGELVKSATERGLRVEHGDGMEFLRNLDDRSLGALVLIQVIEHLTQQQILDFVLLAARKVRPGGQVLVETVNPQSLYVYAHAFYLDPTHVNPIHPAYLQFLFSEAGFAGVAVEWRSPPPEADTLKEVSESTELEKQMNENTRRLNQLLFAPQDYLVTATR
jgi:O-antigen chain-terminating methyltransferase